MNGKTLLMSKTFWVNLIAVVGMVLQACDILPGALWTQYEAVALGAVNVGLRLVTGQPITGIVVLPDEEKPA